MKKLLILASAITMACAVNAATYTWGFQSGEIAGPTDDYNIDWFLDGGYAELFIGGMLIATAEQDSDAFNFGSFDYTANDTTGKVQTLGTGDISESFVGQAYKLVLHTSDDKYLIEYEGTSTYTPVAGAVGEDTKNYEKFMVNTAYTASDWKAAAVPEPTSGLLLLLGVAGLALKRRRE